jgi:hypothetical protein
MSEAEGKLSASQRLENLETGFMSLGNTVSQVINDMLIIKDALKLLDSKLDSVIKATNRGEALTADTISKIMIENEANALKSRVDNLVAQGIFVAKDFSDANSFYVGKEVNEAGEVVNPRLQFGAVMYNEEVQARLLGSKVGDAVALVDPKIKFVVEEIYGVVTPEVPPAEAPVTTGAVSTEASAPSNDVAAAPATTDSSASSATDSAPITTASGS